MNKKMTAISSKIMLQEHFYELLSFYCNGRVATTHPTCRTTHTHPVFASNPGHQTYGIKLTANYAPKAIKSIYVERFTMSRKKW